MPAFFFDTSGIVKRYVAEVGQGWVTTVTHPAAGNSIHLANITGVEVIAAIARRQRGGSVQPADAAIMIQDFRYDLGNQYFVVEVSPTLITHAMTLAETYALRGYDAVQLAAALETAARYAAAGLQLTLVSADVELNAAASAVGLPVEDPLTHP